mgnify:CR=1 FL=1
MARRESLETVCLICCEDLRVVALGACNHRSTCALCSVRMRQLLGDSACVLCKRTLEHVVMTASVDKEFEDFQIWGDGSAAVCKIEGRELPFDEPAQAFFDDKRMLVVQKERKEKFAKLLEKRNSEDAEEGAPPKKKVKGAKWLHMATTEGKPVVTEDRSRAPLVSA